MTILHRPGTFTRAAAAVAFLIVMTTAGLTAEQLKCAECGMPVDMAAPFSSKIIAGDHHLYFCDIGDLLIYLREKMLGTTHARVKDYQSGEWIEAAKAFYVLEPRRFITPMGWGVAAFKDNKDAEKFGKALDMTVATRRLK
jgi:nitrous oxide reductase accessory protein NosL